VRAANSSASEVLCCGAEEPSSMGWTSGRTGCCWAAVEPWRLLLLVLLLALRSLAGPIDDGVLLKSSAPVCVLSWGQRTVRSGGTGSNHFQCASDERGVEKVKLVLDTQGTPKASNSQHIQSTQLQAQLTWLCVCPNQQCCSGEQHHERSNAAAPAPMLAPRRHAASSRRHDCCAFQCWKTTLMPRSGILQGVQTVERWSHSLLPQHVVLPRAQQLPSVGALGPCHHYLGYSRKI